ncbi:MAG: MBL fold metallo-hydrolase [Deltaproteobacteria bacterium]|nr:MBL fold metallo-hydrolase [Deltaproteobacteria bacterium]
MKLTYFGTAMVALDYGGQRFLTDPALDPAGTRYDFGPWYTPAAWFASEKTYTTPKLEGRFDAVLLSHDQHADNLDLAARAWICQQPDLRVYTTSPGARRTSRPPPASRGSRPGEGLGLGGRVNSLEFQARTLGNVTITGTPARHGPVLLPGVHEVTGFLLEAPGEPTVWISGDTVLHDRLRKFLADLRGQKKRIDAAILHCGAVNFPKLPVLGEKLFTFDAAQALETCELADPGLVVPIHRDGWAHFRQPAAELQAAFEASGRAPATRFLSLGDSLSL